MKTILHKDYFKYDIPDNWINDDSHSEISVYSTQDNAKGTITISFYSIFNKDTLNYNKTLDAINLFIKSGKLVLINNIEVFDNIDANSTTYYSVCKRKDGNLCYLWFIDHFPRRIVATYLTDIETPELIIVKDIIKSMRFVEYKCDPTKDFPQVFEIENRASILLPNNWVGQNFGYNDYIFYNSKNKKGELKISFIEKCITEKFDDELTLILNEVEKAYKVHFVYQEKCICWRYCNLSGYTIDENKFIRVWILYSNSTVMVFEYINKEKGREVNLVRKIVEGVHIK